MYIYDAFATVVNNAFGTKRKQYMDKPIDLFPNSEESKQDVRNEVINSLNRWKMQWDMSNKNKGSD